MSRWLFPRGICSAITLLVALCLSNRTATAETPCAQVGCGETPLVLEAADFEQPVCVFVRSRGCPQSPGKTRPRCNFLYNLYGKDGRYHPVDEQALFQNIPAGLPVLILVHGSFVDFTSEPDLIKTFEWIRDGGGNRPLLVLCYRWPSSIGCKAWLGSIAVEQLAQRAEFNGFYLAQLINQVPAANRIALMGHSHGCRMISSALHLLSGGKVDRKRLPPCEWSNRAFRVSFFSAAMDHDWFNPGRCYGLAMNRMSWLQNHRHLFDWALLTYPFRYPGSSRALGQSGFTKKDYRLLGHQAAKIEQFFGQEGNIWAHGLDSHLGPEVRSAVISNIYSP